MINLLNAAAVPFGYTSDMSDSDPPFRRGDCGINAQDTSWRHYPHHHQHHHHHLLDANGSRFLPDVITSNTPPPSPLRRSNSCLAFFAEKPQTQAFVMPPAPFGAPRVSGVEGEAAQARLSHIEEVRRLVQGDAPHTTHLHHLLWPLPYPRRSFHHSGNLGEGAYRGGRESDEGGERQRLWRHIGGDLRKIADQFQLNGSAVSAKASIVAAMSSSSSLPAILSRCLAGTLLCLVWWRLFHGSR